MRGIIKQILYASRRDALFLGTTFIVLICAGLSCFIGSNAVVEAQEARIAYTAGISRIAVMLGFIVFVVFYIKRICNKKNKIACEMDYIGAAVHSN